MSRAAVLTARRQNNVSPLFLAVGWSRELGNTQTSAESLFGALAVSRDAASAERRADAGPNPLCRLSVDPGATASPVPGAHSCPVETHGVELSSDPWTTSIRSLFVLGKQLLLKTVGLRKTFTPLLTGTLISPQRPCNIASASPSWIRTHSVSCAATASATTQRPADASGTANADTMRWPTPSSKPPRKQASVLRRRRLVCSNPALILTSLHNGPALTGLGAWDFPVASRLRPATRSPGPTTTATEDKTANRTFHHTANLCHQNEIDTPAAPDGHAGRW